MDIFDSFDVFETNNFLADAGLISTFENFEFNEDFFDCPVEAKEINENEAELNSDSTMETEEEKNSLEGSDDSSTDIENQAVNKVCLVCGNDAGKHSYYGGQVSLII